MVARRGIGPVGSHRAHPAPTSDRQSRVATGRIVRTPRRRSPPALPGQIPSFPPVRLVTCAPVGVFLAIRICLQIGKHRLALLEQLKCGLGSEAAPAMGTARHGALIVEVEQGWKEGVEIPRRRSRMGLGFEPRNHQSLSRHRPRQLPTQFQS